jgi:hypothetical protein
VVCALLALIAFAASAATAGVTRRTFASGVLCSDAIDSLNDSPFPVILGRVGMQTSGTLQAVPLHGEAFRWWAKSALVVAEGSAPVVISVPPAWRARVDIVWSNRGGGPTSVERVQSCPGHHWLVYPGGFFANARGCIPIDVSVRSRQRRVWVGMGSRAGCPS